MKSKSKFGTKQFLRVSLPSYFFPLLTSGLPGYFLGKEDLLHASYSVIALPSLLATVLSFLILSQLQKRQILLLHRLKITLLLGSFMIALSSVIIVLFGLQADTLNIISSAFMGAAIVSMTTPLKKVSYEEL